MKLVQYILYRNFFCHTYRVSFICAVVLKCSDDIKESFHAKTSKKKKDDVNKMTFIYTVPVCYFLQNTSMILTQIHSLND